MLVLFCFFVFGQWLTGTIKQDLLETILITNLETYKEKAFFPISLHPICVHVCVCVGGWLRWPTHLKQQRVLLHSASAGRFGQTLCHQQCNWVHSHRQPFSTRSDIVCFGWKTRSGSCRLRPRIAKSYVDCFSLSFLSGISGFIH